MALPDPTGRFSERVEDYEAYRPDYPVAVFEHLARVCPLSPDSIVADIGSGTGKLTKLFLGRVGLVYAVEPNPEMRAKAESLHGGEASFRSVHATAETTTLADGSVDLVAAGQAFHWFDQALCRAEFARLLKVGGLVALIWNDRQTDEDPLAAEYEAALRRWCPDYAKVSHKNIDESRLAGFFGNGRMERIELDNEQHFSLDALKGRALSSSYVPKVGAGHDGMMSALDALFTKHEREGQVRFAYRTKVYYGRLA